jgi:hypothetical protein
LYELPLTVIEPSNAIFNRSEVMERKSLGMASYDREIRESESLKAVQEVEVNDLEQIIQKLNADGIIADSDYPTFTSQVMDFWNTKCDDHLRLYGYRGAHLDSCTNYYEDIGNWCVLYDTARYSESDETLPCPREYLDSKAKEYYKNQS